MEIIKKIVRQTFRKMLKYFHESISRLEGSLDTEEEIYPKAQKEAVQKLNELMDTYLADEHRGWAPLFLGFTTEKVGQYFDIPVVTVKPHMSKLRER